MKIISLITLSIISQSYFIIAQPTIQWQKSFGGSQSDVAYFIQQTTDSGYIISGYTQSNDSDVTVNHGLSDYWIVKLNSAGALQWQKSFGGTDADVSNSIQQTSDGGYIVGGHSISDDVDVTGNHGQDDYWIVKLDPLGIKQWQKSLGGSALDRAYSVKQTSDGGYVVAGSVRSTDGDVTLHHGTIAVQDDYWIVRLDSAGAILWQKCLGGGSTDVANSIQQTGDGGFIIAGHSSSNDGDVTAHHGTTSNSDFWIVKLNSNGIIQWQKSIGGTLNDIAYSIDQTSDGGFIVGGTSNSSDGDVSLHYGSFVDNDIWIVRLDSTGVLVWEKTFGGTSTDWAYSIQQTTDGGFSIAGYTNSNDWDLTGLHGINFDFDYWIFKLTDAGIIQWQKVMGGTGNDVARCIQSTFDDGYIVAGSSSSTNGDVTGNNGMGDFWIVKLSPVVSVNEIQISDINFQIHPNPFSDATIISLNTTSENIKIEIRNIEGRLVKNLAPDNLTEGNNKFIWDATNNTGDKINNGIYFITIISNNVCETKRAEVFRD